MKAHEHEFPVVAMCQALGVTRSSYYEYLNGSTGPRAAENEGLKDHIQQSFEASKNRYGSPRITEELRRRGVRCSKNRVARLMSQMGIKATRTKRYVPHTTDSNHHYPVAPNNQEALESVRNINQVWVADITYIRTNEGWLYLAAVMDAYSRKIVGWSLREHLRTELVVEALRKALIERTPPTGLVHHSDRGVQYASNEYRTMLHKHRITPSMSRRGNCYDNAAMESFFGTLKTELNQTQTFETKRSASRAIFEYIEIFYSRKRLHSSLGYLTPLQFEEENKGRIQHQVTVRGKNQK
jgi:transposase InsO family protein